MSELSDLFSNNRAWAEARLAEDPDFFAELAGGQSPSYLWIGCSDSRVPANEIVGLGAGELFVHRNVGNVVEPSDINCLSVLQFGVDVLGVRHVIVCGHYGCGAVQAALGEASLGLIDAWLARIREVIRTHQERLSDIDDDERWDTLCSLNAVEQAVAVCHAPAVQKAWREGRDLSVHGVVYGVDDGLLRDLGFSVSGGDEIEAVYEQALARI